MTSIRDISLHEFLLTLVLVAVVAVVFVVATDFILLIFLAVLFGVFLTQTSCLLGGFLPIGYRWNLAIVVTLMLICGAGGVFGFGMKVESRFENISQNLDASAEKLETWLQVHPMAEGMFLKIPFANELLQNQTKGFETTTPSIGSSSGLAGGEETSQIATRDGDKKREQSSGQFTSSSLPKNAVSKAGSVARRVFPVIGRMMGTTLGLVANLGLIFFMGVFFAVDPPLYRDGLVQLMPPNHRERVAEVLNQMGDAMFAWLNGRFISMAITGIGTGLALLFLGVPLPVTIGIATALLTFIPNVGGLLALLLAMAMALPQGPMTVLWVVVIYGVLQLIESNVITPVVQQHKTSIPPALLLGFQVVLGALTGFLGLLVATPFLAATLVAVKEVWIKDTLGDEVV